MIALPRELFERIVAHCRQEYPREGCGFLAGRDGEALAVYPMRNAEASPVSYLMDPREQMELFRKLDREKLEVVGIYHSHPSSEPYPSEKDRACAFYEEPFYLIVSLTDPSRAQTRAFWIRQGKIEEDKIELCEYNKKPA